MTDKDIAALYREMELQIIASMKRNLTRHMADEADAGFDFPQWQAIKLKELRRYQRENGRIISGATKRIPKSVAAQMKTELTQGRKSEMKRFKEAFGDKFKQSVNLKDSFFRINERKVNSLIGEVKGSFRTAETAALRMSDDVYRQAIFKSSLFMANGVQTPQQALDMAMKDFLARGLNCIEYRDGRRVNIADYASMAIRTASQRAFLIGEGERRQRMGVPFIRISQHNTSCKLCKPFERKVLIDDVYSGGKQSDGEYMLLSEAMARGLFHPRCRHGTATFFPDMEDEFNELGLDYTDPDSPVNDYGSKEINAAHIDNMIQRYKRLSIGSSDPENVAKYEERLRYWEGRKDEESNRIYDDTVDTEYKKYYNNKRDTEQFERYKSVVGSFAPDSFEEFQRLKYEFSDEWKKLKTKYRIINQYKVDSGSLTPEEIYELDDIVITEKRKNFSSKFKKSGNIAGVYIDGDKSNMYFAHSKMSDSSKGYRGTSNLVLLKDKRRFSYIDVPEKDGTMRTETFRDTEAKLFEFFADEYERKPFKSITILSERGMCGSCKGVMEQFKALYPDVKITVVSNKKIIGNVWKYRGKKK